MRAKLVDKIFENPNAINYKGKEISYDSKGIICFAYYNGKLAFSTERGIIHPVLQKRNNLHSDNVEGRSKNSGRLFTEQKIISFWRFPKDKEELLKVLKDLEKETDLDIINDPQWNIEIPLDKKDLEFSDKYANWGKWGATEIFIPIKDYKFYIERSKEELEQEHIIPPMLKKNRSIPSGVGSKRYQTKRPLSWRQAMVQESLEINL